MALAATAAAVDPLYMVPGRVEQSDSPGEQPDTPQCQDSTFRAFGADEICVADCQAIRDNLGARWLGFMLTLRSWQDSTGRADHFWTYATAGSCQFALKRVDGLNTTV